MRIATKTFLLTLAVFGLIITGSATAKTYHDYDYFRDEVRAGYSTIVKDKRGNRVKDNRGNCVLVGHIEPPTTEKRIHDLKYRKDCELVKPKPPTATKIAVPAPAPVVPSPLEIIKQLRDYQVVFFEFDKDRLTPRSRTTLDNFINVMGEAKDVLDVKLYGHADRFGSSKYNINLSQRRVKNVQQYLLDKGAIRAEIIKTEALGESQPVTEGCKGSRNKKTIECLQADRRVEIIVDLTREERQVIYPDGTVVPKQ